MSIGCSAWNSYWFEQKFFSYQIKEKSIRGIHGKIIPRNGNRAGDRQKNDSMVGIGYCIFYISSLNENIFFYCNKFYSLNQDNFKLIIL